MNIYTILVCLERLYQANCSNREVDPPLIFSWWTLHLSLLGSNYSSRRNCLNKLESELYQDLYIYIKLNIANNKLVVLEENWFFLINIPYLKFGSRFQRRRNVKSLLMLSTTAKTNIQYKCSPETSDQVS